jgi:hypothetical protein
MKGRHLKLAGIFAMLLSLCFAFGLHIYVIVHYKHTWSVILVFTLVILAFFVPACCKGYHTDEPEWIVHNTSMTVDAYLNWRDVGFMTAFVLYVLTFLMPIVAWGKSDGVNPSVWAVVMMHVGNACFGYAYALLITLFMFN